MKLMDWACIRLIPGFINGRILILVLVDADLPHGQIDQDVGGDSML